MIPYIKSPVRNPQCPPSPKHITKNVPVIPISLQNQLRYLLHFKFMFLVQFIYSRWLTQMTTIYLANQLGALWNIKLKLLGYQIITRSYLLHVTTILDLGSAISDFFWQGGRGGRPISDFLWQGVEGGFTHFWFFLTRGRKVSLKNIFWFTLWEKSKFLDLK